MRVSQLLERSAQIYSTSPFLGMIEDDSRSIMTYQKALQISRHYQAWIEDLLMNELKKQQQATAKKSGERVEVVLTFLSHNSPDLILAMIGGMNIPSLFQVRIGNEEVEVHVTTAMVNVRWSAVEVSKALAVKENGNRNGNTRHMTLILHSNELKNIAEESSKIINMDTMQHGHEHFSWSCPYPAMQEMSGYKEEGHEEKIKPSDSTNIHDDALLLFTSGTTSGPKGVRLSNLSLLIQAMAKTTSPCSYDPSTQMLATTVPFFHVGGVSSALAIVMCGGMLIFPSASSSGPAQGFNPQLILRSMYKQRMSSTRNLTKSFGMNTLVIVPAMLHSIFTEIESKCNTSPSNQNNYEGVRLLLVGGQSITIPQLQKAKKYFPNARIVQTYACTEAGSSITFTSIHDPNASTMSEVSTLETNHGLLGSCAGFPPHHVDLKIFKLDSQNQPTTNQHSKPFQVGAIGTRGPHVMNGYWKRGQIESNSDQANEWLIMNDLGYLDNSGQLFFCGRSNDVIRTGGESVFAPEVEKVIIQYPDIDQCAVFAVSDEKFGESVCAAIVLKHGYNTERVTTIYETKDIASSIRTFCKDRNLTGYKHPRSVFICKELPTNSSGKVLKHVLASKCAEIRQHGIRSKL